MGNVQAPQNTDVLSSGRRARRPPRNGDTAVFYFSDVRSRGTLRPHFNRFCNWAVLLFNAGEESCSRLLRSYVSGARNDGP